MEGDVERESKRWEFGVGWADGSGAALMHINTLTHVQAGKYTRFECYSGTHTLLPQTHTATPLTSHLSPTVIFNCIIGWTQSVPRGRKHGGHLRYYTADPKEKSRMKYGSQAFVDRYFYVHPAESGKKGPLIL